MIRLGRRIERNQCLVVTAPGLAATLSADEGSEPLYDLLEHTELVENLGRDSPTFLRQGKKEVLGSHGRLVFRVSSASAAAPAQVRYGP